MSMRLAKCSAVNIKIGIPVKRPGNGSKMRNGLRRSSKAIISFFEGGFRGDFILETMFKIYGA